MPSFKLSASELTHVRCKSILVMLSYELLMINVSTATAKSQFFFSLNSLNYDCSSVFYDALVSAEVNNLLVRLYRTANIHTPTGADS